MLNKKEPAVESKFGVNFITIEGLPKDTVYCFGREKAEGESFEHYIKSKNAIVIKSKMTKDEFMERYPGIKLKEE